VDTTFPVEDAIDFADDLNNYRNLVWLRESSYLFWTRMSESFPASGGYSVFGNAGARPDDVEQGSVGDCWFLSASGAMAEDAQRLMDIFVVKEYNEAGIFAINFYQLGVPVTVIVDDFVPHYGNHFSTVFAKVQ